MIVFDASVFAKLFLVQEDRAKAEALIEHLLTNQIEIIAPSAFIHEALSIALRYDVPSKPSWNC
jgi:predicted nucleic acid-binding protein